MENNNQLTVTINSFSFKKGIPEDKSSNGGGYVFDCRGILNPGRIDVYKTKTGLDKEVIDYLENETEMPIFLDLIKQTLAISLNNYVERNFLNLQISFGCTGGQHRSVYCAEKMTSFIKENYPTIRVNLKHIEQEAKNWINTMY